MYGSVRILLWIGHRYHEKKTSARNVLFRLIGTFINSDDLEPQLVRINAILLYNTFGFFFFLVTELK